MKISQLLDTSPKWEHKDAGIRLQSLKSPTIPPEVVTQLAQSDPDLEVRKAAISQVNNSALLIQLATSELPEINPVAIERCTDVIGSDLTKFDLVTGDLPNALLISLATRAEHLDIKCRAASFINDKNSLEQLLLSPNHSRVHQLMATQLCESEPVDTGLLERILSRYRDKDKNVARIIKGKLQWMKSVQEHEQSFLDGLEKNITSLEKLALGEYSDDFERRFAALKDKWIELQDQTFEIPTQSIQRFKQADIQCQAKLDDIAGQIAIRTAISAEIISSLHQLTESLQSSASTVDALAGVIFELRQRWPVDFEPETFNTLAKPLENLHQSYLNWCKIEGRIKSLRPAEAARELSRLDWPDGFAKPSAIEQARSQLEKNLEQRQQSKSELSAKTSELMSQLEHLEKAIEEGHLKPATKLLGSINRIAEQFPVSQKAASQIHMLETRLKDLRDWQGYATNPKREELCASMERLATDLSIPPREKSIAIKELQDQWKKLGASDDRYAQKLWSQFRKHGTLAFKPCAEYFASQNQFREQNLIERDKICTSLELYLKQNNWQNANWKNVLDILNTARQEWHHYDDIPHAKRRKIQGRFNRVMNSLQAKLNEEQQKNHKIKSDLIDEMKNFDESTISIPEMVDRTKAIQSTWKSIGITDRRVDQKLWKQFRAQCDQVFKRRDEKLNLQKKEANEKSMAVRNTLASFSDFIQSEQVIQQSDINKFKKAFNTHEKTSAFRPEFTRLVKTAGKIIDQQVQASQLHMMSELKRLSGLCTQYETGEINLSALETEWQSDIKLDKNMQSRIDHRRCGQVAEVPTNPEVLCIKLEILAGIDSPPGSADARMAYQVERLNRELSQGIKETRPVDEQIRDIQTSWYCLPADNLNPDLITRFNLLETKFGV